MLSNPSTALMLILHGSPREDANTPAVKLAAQIGKSGRFNKVIVAYMECNLPTILQAISECACEGIGRVIALPWFLHAGRHLVLDVPALLIQSAKEHPDLEILITEPVGTSAEIAAALAYRAAEAINDSNSADVIQDLQ